MDGPSRTHAVRPMGLLRPDDLLRVAEHDETLDEARTRNVRDALLEDIGSGDWTGQQPITTTPEAGGRERISFSVPDAPRGFFRLRMELVAP